MASVAAYILFFLYFYPPFYTTLDENNYIRSAYLIQQGSFEVKDPFYRYGFVYNGRGYVPYSFGMPVLLLPFTFFGWNAVFLSGLAAHLLATLVFYKVLSRLGKNPNNVLLYLFFPYFFYYGTTLFPDFHSALFILTGFYFYIAKERRRHLISGALFGFACLLKYTNLLAFLPFAMVSLIKDRPRLGYILLGFLPFALLILALNQTYYGGWFTTAYAYDVPNVSFEGKYTLEQAIPLSTFSLSYYKEYIPFASFRLLLVYPLMLLAPFFYRGTGRREVIIAVVIFFAFFSARYQSGWGFNLDPSTLTRYFLPIMPLFLLTYIPFYERLVKRLNLPRSMVLYGAVLILISGGIFILSIQKERLEIQRSVSGEIYSSTELNALLIGEMDVIRYIIEPFGDRRFLDSRTQNISTYFDDKTYIIHKRFEKPSPVEEGPSKITEKLAAESNAKLIKKARYITETRFFSSRPFVLEIYKIENGFILEGPNQTRRD
jgi:hypothetical protein